MKIVVGLGNPGPNYKSTRHNIGFMAVNELAGRFPVEKERSKFDAVIGETKISNEAVLLVKPLTFMNLSGNAVQPLMKWYKIPTENLLIIYDDLDLPVGEVRIRTQGGPGGHKGMTSIIERLGTREIARIRIGIGRPDHQDTVSWVLGKFSCEEEQLIGPGIQKAVEAVECWANYGINRCMNTYN